MSQSGGSPRNIAEGSWLDAVQPLSVGRAFGVAVWTGGLLAALTLLSVCAGGVRLRRRGPVSRKEGVGHAALALL